MVAQRASLLRYSALPVFIVFKVPAIKTNNITRVGDVLTAVLFKINIFLDII